GLLGTVIGIYRALIGIAVAGSASIDKVAGPVGEALIMTAIGLLVAVPAVLAYNWLQSRNRRIAELLSGFSTDILANITSRGPAVRRHNRRQPPPRRLAELPSGFSTDILANITSGGTVTPAMATASTAARPAAAPAAAAPKKA